MADGAKKNGLDTSTLEQSSEVFRYCLGRNTAILQGTILRDGSPDGIRLGYLFRCWSEIRVKSRSACRTNGDSRVAHTHWNCDLGHLLQSLRRYCDYWSPASLLFPP